MIIDEKDLSIFHFQSIRYTHISLRFIRNSLFRKNGVFTEQHKTISTIYVHRCILISIHRLEHTIYLLNIPGCRTCFLQTNYVSILLLQISNTDISTFGILCLCTKIPSII